MAQRTAGSAGRTAARSEWVERLGRAGLLAKGVLYVTIAVLALQVALGSGGQTVGQQGALRTLAGQPFGTLLLVLLTIGLAGYAVWRLAQGFLDETAGEDGAKALALRASYFARGVFYAGLAVLTLRLLAGSGGGAGGDGQTAGRLLGLPFGRALVILAGIVAIAVGLYQGYTGLRKKFREDLRTAQMTAAEDRWVTRLGMLGHAARAVVFTLIGVFLLRAAVQFDPNQPVGLDAALGRLAQTSQGPWLLGVVAAGLLAYGVFAFALARYGRIRQQRS